VETWFERDRSNVRIEEADSDYTLADWWDEDVQQLAEDGFLDFASVGRLRTSAVRYADYLGISPYPARPTLRYVLYATDEDGRDRPVIETGSLAHARDQAEYETEPGGGGYVSAWVWDSRRMTATALPDRPPSAAAMRRAWQRLPRARRGLFP